MKRLSEFLSEAANTSFKKGEMVNFHDDFKKMQHGKITQIRKVKGDVIYTIDNGVATFKRKEKDVYEF